MPGMQGRGRRHLLGPKDAGPGQAQRGALTARADCIPGAAVADGQACAALGHVHPEAGDEGETTAEA